MSLISNMGFMIYPDRKWVLGALSLDGFFIDTAGEHQHAFGYVVLEGGISGGSKTMSSAGGKVHWRTHTSATTFANAGTTLRLGVQDMSTTLTSQGNDVFDVSGDLVGGTDTIASNTAYATAMGTGTKTIAHGDMIAIAIEMISKGGTDSIPMPVWDNTTADVSPWPGSDPLAGAPVIMIEFDDGTFGWVYNTLMVSGHSTAAFNLNTTVADEYGNLFILPANVNCAGVTLSLSAAFTADLEVILYSDPLGTPVVEEVIVVDGTTFQTAGTLDFLFGSKHLLKAGTSYAVTCRPTTVNSITLNYQEVEQVAHWLPAGAGKNNVYAVRRIDNSGAFSDYNGGTAKTRRLNMSLIINEIHAGAGNASYNLGI